MSDQSFAMTFDRDAIEAFCRKWHIREFSLFGSVLNPEQFRAESDVDVLVVFEEGERDWGAWGSKWGEMGSEAEQIFGRKVDIVERRRLVNPFIRHSVLTTHRLVYAA
jgi:predicted nucleotidyltransferase